MALTPAERFQAISGPIVDFVRQVQKDLFGDNLAGTPLDLPLPRGTDFRVVAEAVLTLDQLPSTSQVTSRRVQKWLGQDVGLDEETQSKVIKMFTLLSEIANNTPLNRVFSKPTKMSPIELVMSLVLLGIHGEGRDLDGLADLIGQLRKHTRALHADVRQNSKVNSTMMQFILNVPGLTEVSSGGRSSSARHKRKRASELEDGEYEPKLESLY